MRQKLFLITAAASCLATPVWAQTSTVDTKSPDYHEIFLALDDNHAMTQHIVVTKSNMHNGKTVQGSATSDFELSFTKTDSGYDVTKVLTQFTPGDGLFANISNDPIAVSSAITQTITMTVPNVSYAADENLTPLGLKNWDDLKPRLATAMTHMMTSHQSALTPDQVKQFISRLFDQLTPETASHLILETDFQLAEAHNVGLVLNVPDVTEEHIQAPIGGSMLDAHDVLTLTKWDEAHNEAHITYDFTPTPESLNAYAKDFIPKAAQQLGASTAALAALDTQLKAGKVLDIINMTTHCDYDLAIDSGVVRKGHCVKINIQNIAGEQNGTVQITDFSEAFKK